MARDSFNWRHLSRPTSRVPLGPFAVLFHLLGVPINSAFRLNTNENVIMPFIFCMIFFCLLLTKV